MRKDSKTIVIRVTTEVWDFVKKEAEAEKITIRQKARIYLHDAIEKHIANS